MATNARRVIYMRDDGKWAWQLAVNGQVIATDAGQGYENKSECREMADRVIGGYYREAERRIRDRQSS